MRAPKKLTDALAAAGFELVEEGDDYQWWSVVVNGRTFDLRVTEDE